MPGVDGSSIGMEDDDDASSSSRLLNHNIASLLYCHEDPLVSSTPPPPPPSKVIAAAAAAAVSTCSSDELQLLAAEHVAKQRLYAPARGYEEQLRQQQQLSCARCRGVHYIIYAFGRLGLAVSTAFNAVNYLDRFLSINCHLQVWEAWMVELLSVACLSIACKLDEVDIPSIHQLQIEEVMRHSFHGSTVRDMELTLLKALQWRLSCVTPYSFLQLLLTTTTCTATAAATRLLIRSLAEPSLLRFDPSVIAWSALRCAALLDHNEDPRHISCSISRLLRLPPDCPIAVDNNNAAAADECFQIMETISASSCLDYFKQAADHHQSLYSSQHQWRSPISVIPSETETETAVGSARVIKSSSAVSRCLFGGASSTPQGNNDR